MSHFAIPQPKVPGTRQADYFRRRQVSVSILALVLLHIIVLAASAVTIAGPVAHSSGQSGEESTQTPANKDEGDASSQPNWVVNTTAEGRTLIAADPNDPINYIRASLASYNQGNINLAIQTLEEGRKNADASALLLVALGALYDETGRLADAEEVTRSALALEPDNVDAQVQLADINLQGEFYQNAADSYRAALKQDEKNARAQRGLVYSLIALNLGQEAEYECRIFLTGDVGRADLWLALGESLEKQQKMREAFSAYGQALVFDSNLAAAHTRRGRLYCRFGQFEAAANECRAALALDPEDAMAHAYLGIACSQLGLEEEARRHAMRAEESGLHMESVWEKLGK